MAVENQSESSPTHGVLDPAADPRDGRFSALDVVRARQALSTLHEQVAFGRGRVEIMQSGCDRVCVMISKAELEALETALEILSDTADYKAMCETLSQVAAATGGYLIQSS